MPRAEGRVIIADPKIIDTAVPSDATKTLMQTPGCRDLIGL